MNNLHITQYTAWLEIDLDTQGGNVRQQYHDLGAELSSSLVRAEKMHIPITSFSIESRINAIPRATVQAATGWDITKPTAEEANIHRVLESESFGTGDYVHASLMFRNMVTDKQVCIFDGFILRKNFTYTVSGLHLTFHLAHWAVILQACPVVCSSLTIDSARYTSHLLHKKIDAPSGGRGAAETAAFSKWAPVVQEVENSIRPGVGQVVPTIFKPVLDALHKHNLEDSDRFEGFAGNFTPAIGNLPAGYRLEDILGSMAGLAPPTGFSVPGARDSSAFPGLELRGDLPFANGDTLRGNLVRSMVSGLGDMQVLQGSAWSFLQQWASLFRLAIVPRVHEIRFIPLWDVFSAKAHPLLELADTISATGGASMVDPAACMLALPAEETPEVINKQRFFSWFMTGDTSRRGSFRHPKKVTGLVDISVMPPELSRPPSGLTREVPNRVAALYAESEFWTKHYLSSIANVLSPIRFDVCPGSTVQFGTGENFLSSISCVGYIHQVQWIYNTTQGASCVFDLGFVRSRESGDGVKEHLYYREGPFLSASWTSDSTFKTF